VTGVRLVPHDPSWPAQAEALCAAWRRLPGAVAAHHIGSTALAIDAKPVRDHLRRFPARAAAYQAEKHRCAALHPTDRAAYTACKAPLIALLDAEAAR
jgi:GrpB-like predicted nucleotidyltransferase (UPF0157 family)